MILNLIEKIFLIIFGVLVVVILFGILSKLATSSSCEPKELFKEEDILGFGGGIFDNLFDTMCSSILDINSGIWGVYTKFAVELFGLKPALLGISNGLWGLGKIFCKSHSNFEYVNRQGSDAITDPEVFKDLFLYEAERCWNLFEGKNLGGLSEFDRNPIANVKFFQCSEIIYSFPAGQSLNLKELYDRLYMKNTCGYPTNIPKHDPERFNIEKGEIQWCVQKDMLADYWWDKDAKLGKYDGTSCELITKGVIDSTSCLGMKNAMCSLGQVYTYSQDANNIWQIEGTGKISIYYYDQFVDTNIIKMMTKSVTSIGSIISFSSLDVIGGISSSVLSFVSQYDELRKPNLLYVYYEKYNIDSHNCAGTLNCDVDVLAYDFPKKIEETDCYYSYGCNFPITNILSFSDRCANKDGYNCSTFTTKNICESNELAGCSWTNSGTCGPNYVQGRGCDDCGVTWYDTASACDQATLCQEYWYWRGAIYTQSCQFKSFNIDCGSLKSRAECETSNGCAGCVWRE